MKLVDSTRARRLRSGPEDRARKLVEARIDAINMHHSDWTAEQVDVFRSFGLRAFAWDAQTEEVLDAVLTMRVDAVYSDHVDRMMRALSRVRTSPGRSPHA